MRVFCEKVPVFTVKTNDKTTAMKKFLATTVLATCLLSTVLQAREKADTTYWKGNGTAGINLSQVSLTHWSAGGDPAIAMDAFFNYESEFKKAKHQIFY